MKFYFNYDDVKLQENQFRCEEESSLDCIPRNFANTNLQPELLEQKFL